VTSLCFWRFPFLGVLRAVWLRVWLESCAFCLFFRSGMKTSPPDRRMNREWGGRRRRLPRNVSSPPSHRGALRIFLLFLMHTTEEFHTIRSEKSAAQLLLRFFLYAFRESVVVFSTQMRSAGNLVLDVTLLFPPNRMRFGGFYHPHSPLRRFTLQPLLGPYVRIAAFPMYLPSFSSFLPPS